MKVTYHEAHLARLTDRALQGGRHDREAPTFTARGMASAVKGLRGVRHCPNEYDGAGLLDRMGVSPDRLHKRSTQTLPEVLPRRSSQVRSTTEERDTHTLFSPPFRHIQLLRVNRIFNSEVSRTVGDLPRRFLAHRVQGDERRRLQPSLRRLRPSPP